MFCMASNAVHFYILRGRTPQLSPVYKLCYNLIQIVWWNESKSGSEKEKKGYHFFSTMTTRRTTGPKTGPKTRRTYTPAQKAIRRLGAGGAGGILCRDSVSPSRIKALLCTATFARSRRGTGPATTCRSSSVWRRYGDGSVSCKSWKGGIGENGKRRRSGRVKCAHGTTNLETIRADMSACQREQSRWRSRRRQRSRMRGKRTSMRSPKCHRKYSARICAADLICEKARNGGPRTR